MKLIHKAMAGTMESSDIMVTIEPKEEGGIQLELTIDIKIWTLLICNCKSFLNLVDKLTLT